MVFPHSLKTNAISLYILEKFEWYRRGVAFPPLPLPSDYEDLCSDFNLAATEEAARDFELPEIPQVVFLAMLLNDAVTLGILCGWMIDIMESTLKELWRRTFQVWVGRNRSNILRACYPKADSNQEKEEDSGSDEASPLPSDEGDEKTLKWHLRGTEHPPRPLLKNYHGLCPCFDLDVAEEAARDFCIPNMTQAVFYTMVISQALELGVVNGDLAKHLKSSLEGL
ncbi:hypothetical protein Cgig2_011945 [Carnegiea gigantea]|uniref:Uncharacterized protein n=1 Tax=Carnegiea gigantea TaxID=171969 RepID=A0A9Q1JKD9_9CARY|nr:hypothetical protein Cgig2_011945 [Carnegiea gigantea]